MVSTEEVEQRKSWRYLGAVALALLQKYRRSKRLKNFDIFSVLACPECKGDLIKKNEKVVCTKCNIDYSTSPFLNFDCKL